MKTKDNTVLIIDGGGRGAVLAYKYAKSAKVSKILLVPGNDFADLGIEKEVLSFTNLKTTDEEGILKIAREHCVDLVDVAQDDAVAAGISDLMESNGFTVWGPSKKAGKIEWDKSWSREFMIKYGLPAPGFKTFSSTSDGIFYINSQPELKRYVKASGLAAGKGAIFAESKEEAISAVKDMSLFGKSGENYLIEDCLEGEEFSAFAIVNGEKFSIIDYAQDHKKVFDDDKGPNTGGMGCVARPLVISGEIEGQTEEIFKQTVAGLVKENASYRGILYLGGMVDKEGKVWIVEFNARWGDPEAEVIVPFIKEDYFDIVNAAIAGRIPKKISVSSDYRIVVAVAAKGYPQDYSQAKGKKISGLDKVAKESLVFAAGIKKEKGDFLVAGGRLFYLVASGRDVADARKKAYDALSLISVEGNNAHFRKDIGWRDMERHNKETANKSSQA